jgi:serpin B
MEAPIASQSLNYLTQTLYEHLSALSSESGNENLFFSPFSISTAMAMTLPGARNDTQNQLQWLLGPGKSTDEILTLNKLYMTVADFINLSGGDGLRIKSVNKVYVNDNLALKPEYSQTLAKVFDSSADKVEFANPHAAADKINGFVAEHTNNKIDKLIDPTILDALTRLVLVNAVHFRGEWFEKFNKDLTAKEDFHLSDGTVKQVDMMRLHHSRMKYLKSPGGIKADTAQMNYSGQTVSMTIILPHENVPITDVEKELNADVIHEILSATRGSNDRTKELINFQLPKFRIEFKSDVSVYFRLLISS